MKEEFIKAVDENKGIIFKVCNMYCRQPEDKEDLFQDIVYQLWRSFKAFKGESKFSTWMYRISINTAITRLRKESKEKTYEKVDIHDSEIPDMNNEPNERLELMYHGIEKLSDVEKAIVLLYLDDHSYKDMAEIIGTSESNIGFKLNRIRSKLKTIIKDLRYGT